MKKIIFAIVLFFAVVSISQAQNLYSATYTTNIRDTIAVNGSTDAGSDWFTNAGYEDVWVEVYNGAYWYTCKVDANCKNISKFKVAMEGSDSTVMVQGYLENGQAVTLPLKNGSITNIYVLDLTVTTAYYVAFRGVYRRDL